MSDQTIPTTTPVEPGSTTPTETAPITTPVTNTAPVVPEAPALTFGEGIPQAVQEFAKTQKLNQAQFDNTFKFFNDTLTQANTRATEESYQRGKAHVESWGEEASAKIGLAKRALQVADPEGNVTKYLKETGAANNPVVMDFLVGLGKMLQEGGFIKTSMATPEGQKTLADKLFGGTHKN